MKFIGIVVPCGIQLEHLGQTSTMIHADWPNIRMFPNDTTRFRLHHVPLRQLEGSWRFVKGESDGTSLFTIVHLPIFSIEIPLLKVFHKWTIWTYLLHSPSKIHQFMIHDWYTYIYILYIDLLHLPKKYIQTVKVLYVLYVGPPQGTWRYAGASWSG